jgi:3-methyl-2-oxobutanoate hydroxymethyltransferase
VAGGAQHVVEAAKAFRDAADCDAVKIEALPEKIELVEALAQTEVDVIAHLGLQPQTAERREQLKVQARNAPDMERLASQARDMVSAGAAMILLEAVPPEAAQSVRDAIEVPLIGCGAGPACDGFVVVTHDLLGLTERPPKFVPVLEHLRDLTVTAMTRWREMIADGSYPAAEHNYRLGSSPEDAATR